MNASPHPSKATPPQFSRPASAAANFSARAVERRCACGTHTMGGMKCHACGALQLQRKLAIGATNDPLEQEADRIADHVLAGPAHTGVSASPPRTQCFNGQLNPDAETAP